MRHVRFGGKRPRHGRLVREFVQISPSSSVPDRGNGAGYDQHRDGIGVGLSDCRGRVRDSRPGDEDAYAGSSGNPRIAVGHEGGALFVPGEYVGDVRPGQSSVELQRMNAGNAEDEIDAVGGQQINERFAAASFGRYDAPTRALAIVSGRA